MDSERYHYCDFRRIQPRLQHSLVLFTDNANPTREGEWEQHLSQWNLVSPTMSRFHYSFTCKRTCAGPAGQLDSSALDDELAAALGAAASVAEALLLQPPMRQNLPRKSRQKRNRRKKKTLGSLDSATSSAEKIGEKKWNMYMLQCYCTPQRRISMKTALARF